MASPASDTASPGADPALEEPASSAHAEGPLAWRTNAVLFLATLISTFLMGAYWADGIEGEGLVAMLRGLPSGWTFAVPLLAILLTHEFGHYFAARIHRVPASLPYFIPAPFLSPFGTMGALISMRGSIRSRNALLDIGAAGPLAGLVVALPVLMVGLALSKVAPVTLPGAQEGQSLLYMALKRVVVGPIPEGHDVFLHPAALAGWAGLFVTALNLLPVGQLDGGHIAYALFGPRQNRYARIVHQSLLVVFAYNVVVFVVPVLERGSYDLLPQAVGNSTFWLMWFGILHLLRRVGGPEHPPTEPGELSPARRGVAVLSLALFVLLFMPTPMATYSVPALKLGASLRALLT